MKRPATETRPAIIFADQIEPGMVVERFAHSRDLAVRVLVTQVRHSVHAVTPFGPPQRLVSILGVRVDDDSPYETQCIAEVPWHLTILPSAVSAPVVDGSDTPTNPTGGGVGSTAYEIAGLLADYLEESEGRVHAEHCALVGDRATPACTCLATDLVTDLIDAVVRERGR